MHRIQSLEATIRETYQLIETDEVIKTMQNSKVSDEFRRQRIQEIVEDSLLHEKETQIEKLNQINSYLKTEIKRADEDRNRISQVYQEEVIKFQKTISEFEAILENEVKTKNQYKQEYDNLAGKLAQLAKQHEELMNEKDTQIYQNAQSFQNEISRLKLVIEELSEKLNIEEQNSKRKDQFIAEMQKDIEIFRREYAQLEHNFTTVAGEHETLQKRYNLLQEATTQLELELNSTREALRKTEEEYRVTSAELQQAQKEKLELVNKTDYISAQVKKVHDNKNQHNF